MKYCSQCAAEMAFQEGWPRRCPGCSREFFKNPTPVAVVVVPVDGGILTVRRAIPPQVGHLALPGGFVNWGETWQQAACREVFEETSLVILPEELSLLELISVPEGNLLIFCRARPRARDQLQLDFRNEEVSEMVVLYGPQELAFPTHTRMLGQALGKSSRTKEASKTCSPTMVEENSSRRQTDVGDQTGETIRLR